jgi:4,5-dihydroxyphthalate decarboxylase
MARADVDDIPITIATANYDHVRDLVDGTVAVPGLRPNFHVMPVEQIFGRFLRTREWEVAEISMGKYIALVSQGDKSLAAIPVFPARVFRHAAIYVGVNGRIHDPRDLRGSRVGIPEWALTAVIYARALLAHQFGVGLKEIDWVQGGLNEPGGAEKVKVQIPSGVNLSVRTDKSLSEMLLSSEIDALIAAEPPKSFGMQGSSIRRLFEDSREAETAYWRQFGILPIMHTIVIRHDVLEARPWIASALFDAFDAAKKRSVARLFDRSNAHIPLPWVSDAARSIQAEFGENFWPYGIRENIRTLESFAEFSWEQGVSQRKVTMEEMFVPSLLNT